MDALSIEGTRLKSKYPRFAEVVAREEQRIRADARETGGSISILELAMNLATKIESYVTVYQALRKPARGGRSREARRYSRR